jgi:uncharacterized DUF497 family protein
VHQFRWNQWNERHIGEHGIEPNEAEYVVKHPARGYPRRIGDEKTLVLGQTDVGRYLEVIFVFDPPGVKYVIHARELTDAEKRRLRRGKRR